MTIGTNNLLRDCNANVIVVGNIVIVHTIQQWQLHAHIVINSLLPQQEVTLWAILQEVNVQLQCWVDAQDSDPTAKRMVDFFNAMELFVWPINGRWNQDLFANPIHPNGNEYWVWGKAITQHVQAILDSN